MYFRRARASLSIHSFANAHVKTGVRDATTKLWLWYKQNKTEVRFCSAPQVNERYKHDCCFVIAFGRTETDFSNGDNF